jgi:hypothetical protein
MRLEPVMTVITPRNRATVMRARRNDDVVLPARQIGPSENDVIFHPANARVKGSNIDIRV